MATVNVKNTGGVKGKEVVQLYIRDVVGSATRPVQELKGFQKIELAAGEELNPLIPHTAEIIVGFIAFSLLYMVLRRAVVPRFEKAFAERTDAIQGGMERAERAQREAEAALNQYKAQLADARGEAQSIREEARVQGAAIIEEMRAKAQEEASRITATAQEIGRAHV